MFKINKLLFGMITVMGIFGSMIMLVSNVYGSTDSKSNIDEEFPYTYIYIVNEDKCVSVKDLVNIFNYSDLKNPKLVAEFQDRPGELIFIGKNDEMLVFTDTDEHCQEYRNYFLEQLELSNLEEDMKYLKSDLDDLEIILEKEEKNEKEK